MRWAILGRRASSCAYERPPPPLHASSDMFDTFWLPAQECRPVRRRFPAACARAHGVADRGLVGKIQEKFRTVLWRPLLMSVLSVPAQGEARSPPTWRSMEFRLQ